MKISLYFLFILSFFTLGFLPDEVKAVGSVGAGGQYFGGRHNLAYNEATCSCSGSNVHFIQDYATHKQIKLFYQGARVYQHNDVNFSTLQIGSYNYGGTTCMETGEPCTIVSTVDGTYSSTPGVGTAVGFYQKAKLFMSTPAEAVAGIYTNGDV